MTALFRHAATAPALVHNHGEFARRDLIAPGVDSAVSSSRSLFPLRLCWQVFSHGFAECDRVKPTQPHLGLFRAAVVVVCGVSFLAVPTGDTVFVLFDGGFKDVHVECLGPHGFAGTRV